MAGKDKTETVVAKRLRVAMSQRRMDERNVADAAGLSATAVHKILTGQTRKIRTSTLSKLSGALGYDVGFFQSEENAHLSINRVASDEELVSVYGPSVRTALRLGGKRTLWLNYDTATETRYNPDTTVARIADREPTLPPQFLKYRADIEAYNEKLIENPELGKAFFDGPTFCLSRYSVSRSSDGHETKTLSVEFSRSRYANNKTAKSGAAANLRKRYLRAFNFLDQPIEWLASGVGVAVVVFCEDGERFIAARRSDSEQFRSREWDISVVEGINPVKDRRSEEENNIRIHDVVVRAVYAELGIEIEYDDVNIIAFGVDLEYYQWNFIAYVNTKYSFRQIEDFWQSADEKEESMEIKSVGAEPKSAAKFIRDNTVWSCGMAALYFSLIKRFGGDAKWREEFHSNFDGTPATDNNAASGN